MKKPTLKSFEKALGPASEWSGRCYELASKTVEKGLVQGTAVYGHWTGPVHPESMFYRGGTLPFVQHGWVLLEDGTVVDPTRWVFEHKKPYIYSGPADHYDEGGSRWREAMQGPCPDWEFGDQSHHLTHRLLSGAAWTFLEKLLDLRADDDGRDIDEVSVDQLRWLANANPKKLGRYAPDIYRMLKHLDMDALIPIDNQRMVDRLYGSQSASA